MVCNRNSIPPVCCHPNGPCLKCRIAAMVQEHTHLVILREIVSEELTSTLREHEASKKELADKKTEAAAWRAKSCPPKRKDCRDKSLPTN